MCRHDSMRNHARLATSRWDLIQRFIITGATYGRNTSEHGNQTLASYVDSSALSRALVVVMTQHKPCLELVA